MMNHLKKASFLFFIEQKNTRTNVNPWKKVFYGWLDVFKDFTEEHINSMAWVITKCPADVTEESMSKRLNFLKDAIKNEKLADPILVDKIFDAIINNNRFYISRKGTGKE